MDLKPLITIKGTSDLSLSQAHKLIKKFHTTSVSTKTVSFNFAKQDPNVAEDTLDKLTTLVEEIRRRAEIVGEKISVANDNDNEHKSHTKDSKEKKRKREKSECADDKAQHGEKDADSSEKKKKKSKKSDK